MPLVTPPRYHRSLRAVVCVNCGENFGSHLGTGCLTPPFTRFQYNREDSPMPAICGALRHCENCGESIDTTIDFYNYCESCCEYLCEMCGDCGNHDDDDDDGGCGCDDCRPSYTPSYNSPASHFVRSWDYRPNTWRPKGNYPTEALLGLELEVGGSMSGIATAVRNFDDSENHLYMKRDGSIDGVEIVTHPATLNWSRTGVNWEGLLRELRDRDSYVDDGYGLHVHVSRNAFRRVGRRSTPHQMAWLMFMYRHASELQLLARRHSTQWASFRTPVPGELRRKSADMPSEDDRYVAVNCNNAKTYELRFFKSTLESHELLSALEFADASVEYTRGVQTADVLRGESLTWPHFADWAEGQNYPNLSAEIERVNAETQRAAQRRRVNTRRTATPVPTDRDSAIAAAYESNGVIQRNGAQYEVATVDSGFVMRPLLNPLRLSWQDPQTYVPDGWTVVPNPSANPF